MKISKNNGAAKKMTQKPVRGLKGQSRSQSENFILSGWQGSDEDEEVNIDSSDDEKVFSIRRWKSTNSTSTVLRSRAPKEDSGPPGARDREALATGRDRPVSSPQFERSGSYPEGSSAMKVKSSDARRFRKELTASKSGVKLAVTPRESSNASSGRGSPGSERKDRRKDSPIEDLEEEEVLLGKSPDTWNKGPSVKQSQPGSVGTGDKSDQGTLDSVAETRKRKGRDTRETSDCDDEIRKRRRYRELEQAQRIADRRLTLRERPESRQRDVRTRREASTQSNSVGRRLRMADVSIPRETDTTVRLRSVPVAFQWKESWKKGLQKKLTRKVELSERDEEIALKVFERRSSRITDNLLGDEPPSKEVADISNRSSSVPITDSKDVDLVLEKDRNVEGTPLLVPSLQAVGVSEEPRNNLRRKCEGLSLSDTKAVENALDNYCKNVSTGLSPSKPVDPPISGGKRADVVLELKETNALENETDLFCKESLDRSMEKALDNVVDVPEEMQPSEGTVRKGEMRASLTGVHGNLVITEGSIEAYVAVSTDVGTKPEDEGTDKSREKTRNSADCTALNVSEVDKNESRSESEDMTSAKPYDGLTVYDVGCASGLVSEVSGETVEARESRCLRPPGEGAVDLGVEDAARSTVLGAKPDLNDTEKADDHETTSKADFEEPEVDKRPDKSSDEYNAGREGSGTCSLGQAGDISLSNERIERPMAGDVVLHDQKTYTIAMCDLTVEDADGDHSEEASDVDDHNSFCEACLLGGMLLCCDASGCKVTYHLECADPSMTEVPEGKWYCPSCAQKRLSFGVHASPKTIDSIWDVRDCNCPSCSGCRHDYSNSDRVECLGIVHESKDHNRATVKDLERAPGMAEDSPVSSTGISQRGTRKKLMESENRRQSEKQKLDAVASTEPKSSTMVQSAEDLCEGCDKQYLVKWKNHSHIHNVWVSESELKRAAPKMLESFKKRLETETLNQSRIKWKPVWQVPQKFLSKRLNAPPRRPGGGRGRGYLGMDAGLEWFVKWQDLGYEHCTWEQVQAGVLDCEVSKRLESNYDMWCEGARRRSHPARIEEVMRLRDAKYKILDDPPEWLQRCKLSSRQLEELNGLRERWHHHHNSLMVDEGDQERTTTAAAFLLSLIEEYEAFKPILVIVPGTGCQMWESELQRCAEHVNTVVYAGTLTGRSVIQRHELNPSEKPVKFQIVLTTFDIAISDHDHLGKFEWEAVILDEGHRARLTKSYRHLQFLAPYRLILLSDFSKCTVWELQQFLVYLEPENHCLEAELQRKLEELDEDFQLTFLRGKLAEKMVGDSSFHGTAPLEFREHWIAGDLTPVQAHIYCTELIKHYNLLHNGRTRADQNLGSIYGLAGTLRNVCNHPFLVDPTMQEDLLSILKPGRSLVEAGIQQCGKFKTLQLMVAYLHSKGQRVLLVCQTDMLCYYFDDYMRQIFGADSYECVSKGSETVKSQAIQRFNAENSTRFVFILKRNTAGVSFQLRETDVVIVYDSDWNPANDVQYLEKVIYKVQGPLTIYRLYTPLSVEEAAIVYSRQRRLELQSGIKVLTAKYCQQILKWKVKELFELYDIHPRGASEKELMAGILEYPSETSPDTKVRKILDGDGEAEAENLNEEMPEEDGDVLKEFWSSLLRDRYAALQNEEVTNSGKGLRSRKRVHYSEDALALASYAAGNEEEVRRKRRKSQYSELVQRGSPRANTLHSPAKLVDNSSADEILPVKTVNKEGKMLDMASEAIGGGGAACVPEITTTGVERQVENDKIESQGRVAQREELVQPLSSGKIPTRTASAISSTCNEEGRKTRSEQQQIMLGLWRPDVTKICKTLGLSEKVAAYADQLLVYCMKSYRMPKEPKDLVLQVQIALCVVAAERFHQDIDHLKTLSLVEEAMDVKLKRESWNDNYQKFTSCCKGYPLPEHPDRKLSNQAQLVAVVSDASSKSKSTEEDLSVQRPVASSDPPKGRDPPRDVDKVPAFQIIECCSTGNPVGDPKILCDGRDQRQASEEDAELDAEGGPDSVLTSPAQIKDASGVDEPMKAQGVVENPVVEENLVSTLPKWNKEQILEKLRKERHEIHSVVVYQQTQETSDFQRSNNAEKEDALRRNEEITADLMRSVTDPKQRAIILDAQRARQNENVKKVDIDFKERHEMLVKRQRAIRDEIHSVYSELLRQADEGASRSLYDEAQGILAKMGVKSVSEAQSILRNVGEEARRKKAPVGVPPGPAGQVRSQVAQTSAQSQVPKFRESNTNRAIQHLSLPQSSSQPGAHTQPEPSQVQQVSQPLPSQPPVLCGTQPAQPPQLSQPRLSQVQQADPPHSQRAQATHSSISRQPVQPSPSSVQPHDLHHPLPPRPTMPPRQNNVAVEVISESSHHQLPASSVNVQMADTMPAQILHNAVRTHTLQLSASSQQQRTIRALQLQSEQQRNAQVRRLQTPPIPHQQQGWHTPSSGQGPPTYTRLQPQPQQSSNPSMAVSAIATTHVNPCPTLNSVAQYAQVNFLPPIPPNMMGPDPILQEEARLKKEKENVKATYEKKANEIRKRYGEELEDARRKYEALIADLKRKFDGMIDENSQLCHRHTSLVHQNHVKAHRSRLLAEALRNRAMFDVVQQPRSTGTIPARVVTFHHSCAQQGDEPGSASRQARSVQNGTGFTGLSGRACVQSAQQGASPMRHVATLSTETIVNTGSGQFAHVAPPAGRVLLQPFHQNSNQLLAGSQRETSARSCLGVPSPVGAVPPAFPSGGVVLQHTHHSNLVPTEDVQGQRTDLGFGGVQQSHNLSPGARPPVPSEVGRVPLSSSLPASAFPGSPVIVQSSPGAGPAVGTTVHSYGRGNEPGGALGGGLWPSCNLNNMTTSGGWQNGVPITSQACSTDSLHGRNNGEATGNRVGIGSLALPASTPNIPSSGPAQPAFDTCQPLQQHTSHRQQMASQNLGNGKVNPTIPHQRRSWTLDRMGSLTPSSTASRVGSQSAGVLSEGSSDNLVAAASQSAATERLPTPTLVGSNEVIASSGTPAVVSVNPPISTVAVPQPLSDSSPSSTLSATASREPELRAGGTPAGGLSEGLTDPSSMPLNTSRSDVPIIYLSDDD